MKIILLIWIILFKCYSDQWRSPKPFTAVSPNGVYITRVVPVSSDSGRSYVNVIFSEFVGDSIVISKTCILTASWCPGELFVHNSGSFFTVDQWASYGGRNCVVLYNNNGEVIKSYDLEDLYEKRLLYKVYKKGMTNSSVLWRNKTYTQYGGLVVQDCIGGEFFFDGIKGNYTYRKANTRYEFVIFKRHIIDITAYILVACGILFLLIRWIKRNL